MARPRIINDDDLIKLVDEYFLECGGRIGNLKYADIAQYIRDNGYPEFQNYVLRRNQHVRDYIDRLKEKHTEDITTLVSYRTFDVTGFMRENPSKAKITSTVTALNKYYEKVADSAVKVFKQFKELESQITEMNKALESANSEIEKLRNKVDSLKQANSELKTERDTYKKVVDKYVYPEIANKILSDEGITSLPYDHIVDEPEVITPDNVIPITGKLLSLFKKDEDES